MLRDSERICTVAVDEREEQQERRPDCLGQGSVAALAPKTDKDSVYKIVCV